MSATVDPDATELSIRARTRVMDWPYLVGGGLFSGWTYDVSPDGERVLAIKGNEPGGTCGRIVVVENFIEELKRLVPTN